MPRDEPGSRLPHEQGSYTAALEGLRDVKVVDERAPLRIVRSVRADEPDEVRAVDGDLDELVSSRMIEPIAPDTEAFARQVSVEERVEERAAVVLSPAARVELGDRFRIGRPGWSMLDH
jgi:hypothetical protein